MIKLRFISLLPLLALCASVLALGSPKMQDPSGAERARQLKEYIKKEKPRFEARETQRKDALTQLDRWNAEQNEVRQRMASIESNHQELSMALDNLSVELEKQKTLEQMQKKRLLLLLKTAYKFRKDGLVRFLFNGDSLAHLTGRVRILYHTLRSHTQITRQLEERAARLEESERRVSEAKADIQKLIVELKNQEEVLNELLDKKRRVLHALNQKQSYFQSAVKEYRQVSKQLATLFNNFESVRDSDQSIFPSRGTLPLPLQMGHVVKSFGKEVNERFHTVLYHRGIEIEADHNTPVAAILPGTVEFEGWVKGLGNVVILHHGGGFYSLSAHLFKTLKPRGSRVEQGETVGFVGDTGNNERPSLYFELRENGKAVDPVTYFSPQALASLK